MTSNVGRKMGESLKDAGRRPFELARGCFLLWMETFARGCKEGYFHKFRTALNLKVRVSRPDGSLRSRKVLVFNPQDISNCSR